MKQGSEMSSHAWMITHAVAIDTNRPSIAYTKQNSAIVTDVFLMVLCKAFSSPSMHNMHHEYGD